MNRKPGSFAISDSERECPGVSKETIRNVIQSVREEGLVELRGPVVVHKPETIGVKAIRVKTGMSQQRFCATSGLSLGTLRHWEQGLRSPRGTARVLLKVVDNDPSAVIRAMEK